MTAILRGLLGVLAALVVWELGAQLVAPLLGPVPPPTDVTADLVAVAETAGYWSSWQHTGCTSSVFSVRLITSTALSTRSSTTSSGTC